MSIGCKCITLNTFSVVHNDAEPEQLYAITSDQEKAIKAGLEQSAMKNTAVHTCCSLHAKWGKYVGCDVRQLNMNYGSDHGVDSAHITLRY